MKFGNRREYKPENSWLNCGSDRLGLSPTSLTRTHLLLAGNDTVPILMWRSRGVYSTDCYRPIASFYFYFSVHSINLNVF